MSEETLKNKANDPDNTGKQNDDKDQTPPETKEAEEVKSSGKLVEIYKPLKSGVFHKMKVGKGDLDFFRERGFLRKSDLPKDAKVS